MKSRPNNLPSEIVNTRNTNPAALHAAVLILNGEFALMDGRRWHELYRLMAENVSDPVCRRALEWLRAWIRRNPR